MKKQDVWKSGKGLIVNTLEREKTGAAILDSGKLTIVEKAVQAQDLNLLVDKVLKKFKLSITDIDFVAVLTGPGSYTGSRMGITAANTYAQLLKIPVFDLNCQSFDEVQNLIKTSQIAKILVRPRY